MCIHGNSAGACSRGRLCTSIYESASTLLSLSDNCFEDRQAIPEDQKGTRSDCRAILYCYQGDLFLDVESERQRIAEELGLLSLPGHVSGRVCTRVIVSPCKRCHQTWPLVAAVKPPATSRMRHLSRWLVCSTRQPLHLCQDGGKLSRAT